MIVSIIDTRPFALVGERFSFSPIASTKEKAHKNHKIIELMISGTFDEQIYKLLEQRKSETDIINNYNLYLKKGEKNVN